MHLIDAHDFIFSYSMLSYPVLSYPARSDLQFDCDYNFYYFCYTVHFIFIKFHYISNGLPSRRNSHGKGDMDDEEGIEEKEKVETVSIGNKGVGRGTDFFLFC